MNDVMLANTDVGLGVVIGLLSCIPVIAFIYVAESKRFAWFRLKFAARKEHSRPGLNYAGVTNPSSVSEASIG